MSIKVFIDGAAGTTGLRLNDRLGSRSDVELLQIDPEKRKDDAARAELLNSADIVFLCLPDDAAKAAVSLITNPKVKVLDASTAHRTNESWAYGMPELSKSYREKIEQSTRVAVNGCHAMGFNILAYPLTAGGIAPADYPFVCHSVTGYSGGGRQMIEEYQDKGRAACYAVPRLYGLPMKHKHLPEMQKVCGLQHAPLFNPILGDYYAGMMTSVPVYTGLFQKKMGAADLQRYFAEYYAGQKMIQVMPLGAEKELQAGMIDAAAMAGSDCVKLYICGNEDQVTLVSLFDNLGKGASGAAIQCMNILCGLDEATGLSMEPNA